MMSLLRAQSCRSDSPCSPVSAEVCEDEGMLQAASEFSHKLPVMLPLHKWERRGPETCSTLPIVTEEGDGLKLYFGSA